MAYRKLVSTGEKSNPEKAIRILGLSLLVFLLVFAGSITCKKSGEEGLEIKEGIVEFEGVAKVIVGKYLFVPEVSGFDIIIQGQIESGDPSTLVDKEVRGKGEFSPDRPSVLVANSIDVKESERNWRNVFTRTEEVVLDDYIDLKARNEFKVLSNLSYDKTDVWEAVEKVKIFGRLEKETVTEGEEQKDIYRIVVLDEKDKEVGKIITDSFTDYAQYYMEKLSLFDNLWFYINVKETIDWSVRRKTRELFHADVLFCGIF